MKFRIFFTAAAIMLAVSTYTYAGTKADTGDVHITFKHVINGVALKVNDSTARYANANNDQFTVSTFKYYISNVVLTKHNGEAVALPNTYYLIDAADSTTFKHTLHGIPAGKYNGISFTIGVDSARNFSGAQTGCLDPAKGMFWTWNSGYIFLKMEGASPQSAAKLNKLTFHVGGIKRQNALRQFTRSFGKNIRIESGKVVGLTITTDAAALFKGKNLIDFSKLSYTMGGPNAIMIADNYADGLFSLALVE